MPLDLVKAQETKAYGDRRRAPKSTYSSQKLVSILKILQEHRDLAVIGRPFHEFPKLPVYGLHSVLLFEKPKGTVGTWEGFETAGKVGDIPTAARTEHRMGLRELPGRRTKLDKVSDREKSNATRD